MLASAAGALFLREAVGQDAVPKVEDRGFSIRITNLQAMPIAQKAYLKIETSAKVVGCANDLNPLSVTLFRCMDEPLRAADGYPDHRT